MNHVDIALLFDYNYWANRRILAAASGLSQEQLVAPTSFPCGNLRATLLHILDAEYGWRDLLVHGREAEELSEADFPTLSAVQARWVEEEAAMQRYLGALTDQDLNNVAHYTNVHGVQRERIIWQALYQVLNHGTQHRSEAAAMLTDFGRSPGDLDFSLFLVETVQHST